MNKETLLHAISRGARDGMVTREEVIEAYDRAPEISEEHALFARSLSISDILYSIGGAIVFLGIAVLIGQNWDDLNIFARVLVTLGSGIVSYGVGVYFSQINATRRLSTAFHLIAALVLPLGLGVVMHEGGYDVGSAHVHVAMSVILLAAYLASWWAFRGILFTLFSVIYATWLFFAATSAIVGMSPLFDGDFISYRFLVVGMSYLLLGYSFAKNENSPLTGVLYGFGSVAVLGAGLALGGWTPNQSVFWELIYPLLSFSFIFLSISFKSRAFLTFGSLSLIGYIFKITAEYFADSLSWPLVLVIIGFTLIGIGYLAVHVNRKYLNA